MKPRRHIERVESLQSEDILYRGAHTYRVRYMLNHMEVHQKRGAQWVRVHGAAEESKIINWVKRAKANNVY